MKEITKSRKPKVATLKRACDDFNKKYPVGTAVMLKEDGRDMPTKTIVRHHAYILGGHSAVAFFEGISGSYLIDRVTPLTDESQIKPKYTLEIFDLPENLQGQTIGYRIISHDDCLLNITDADYLMHSLTETLSRIAQVVPYETPEALNHGN